MLMPSTPSVYPQVVSRCFASFRVGIFGVSAGHAVSLRWVRFPAAAPQKGRRGAALSFARGERPSRRPARSWRGALRVNFPVRNRSHVECRLRSLVIDLSAVLRQLGHRMPGKQQCATKRGVDRAVLCTTGVPAYGPSHCVVLAGFAIGAALLVWIGRRQTESQARLLGRVLAVLIVAAFGVALVYKLVRAHHRQLGAAAAVRCRGTHGGLRVVVAAALGLCAHLLLGPRPKLTGVDHTGHRHARGRRARFPPPSFRHVLYASRARCVGGHLSHVGAWDAAAVARLPLRGHRDPRVGGIHLHLQRRSREPTTATSTGNPPPRHCWTYWARGRCIC